MSLAVQVTIDAADPAALAEFWALALGYRHLPPPDASGRWARIADPDGTGPRLFFQRVSDAKTGKNRLHLDVHAGAGVGDRGELRRAVRAHADLLVAAGAGLVRECDEPDQFWIVMRDPEGNEFCLD